MLSQYQLKQLNFFFYTTLNFNYKEIRNKKIVSFFSNINLSLIKLVVLMVDDKRNKFILVPFRVISREIVNVFSTFSSCTLLTGTYIYPFLFPLKPLSLNFPTIWTTGKELSGDKTWYKRVSNSKIRAAHPVLLISYQRVGCIWQNAPNLLYFVQV